MLKDYVITELQQQNVINDIVWMKDSAPLHIATNIRQVLQQHFGAVSRNFSFGTNWIPRPHYNGFLILGLSEV